MDQQKPRKDNQAFYKDRWVDKEHFRAYVYGKDGTKLANSYREYEQLISSGVWFSTKEKAIADADKPKARKPKDGGDS